AGPVHGDAFGADEPSRQLGIAGGSTPGTVAPGGHDLALRRQLVHAVARSIGHVHVSLAIHRDPAWGTRHARIARPRQSPLRHLLPVRTELEHSEVLRVGHKGVALAIKR